MSPEDDQLNPRAQATAWRILDANLNRCAEGFRVVEEYVRFQLEDVHLSLMCKQLRHDLSMLAQQLPDTKLHAMRNVVEDVGTTVATDSEYRRVGLTDVAAANVKRVEQSLRSLEEYAKVVVPQLAAAFESLRYRVYTLEQAVLVLGMSRQRLAESRLYVLVDGNKSPEALRQQVGVLMNNGVDVLQLRDKQLSDLALLERARVVREMTAGSNVLFMMNDRVDLAVAAGADGVHLGQDELPVSEARRMIGPDALIGVSTHRIEQARQAVLNGANYIGCGPTFPSATKSFQQFSGLDFLRQVNREITLPAFAIGGINADNVVDVLQTGFTRVAVSHGVISASDLAHAARTLADMLR